MALAEFLILRKPRSGSLEERTVLIQPILIHPHALSRESSSLAGLVAASARARLDPGAGCGHDLLGIAVGSLLGQAQRPQARRLLGLSRPRVYEFWRCFA
jgi:hypothetical protein